MSKLSDFVVTDIHGAEISLSRYSGQVLLIVNTASKCGFTPQLEGLQELHATYASRGFTVLGFPCNQFMNQEPGSSAEISAFCTDRYAIRFPIFEKIDVNGPTAHPLYQWLKSKAPGVFGSGAVKWNFTKFLVDRTGTPVVRFAPTMAPVAIGASIERLLG
jgi:glutathione peroxidase